MTEVRLSTRLGVSAAVITSYLITLAPLLFFGWDGRWFATLLLFVVAPFLASAGATAFLLADRVVRRPFAWAGAAGAIGLALYTIALWGMTGELWGLVALPFALAAPFVFWIMISAVRLLKCKLAGF